MDSWLRFVGPGIFAVQFQGLKLISRRTNTISVSQESNCERLGLILSNTETHQSKDPLTNFAKGLKVIYGSIILEQSVIYKLNSRFSHLPTIHMYYTNKEKPEYKNSLIWTTDDHMVFLAFTRSRIHERTISLRFLSITLTVLRLNVSVLIS